jgi:hypothetical protein
MRTLVITTGCLALVLMLTSFAPLPWTTSNVMPKPSVSISTSDLTLGAGALNTPDYADAH